MTRPRHRWKITCCRIERLIIENQSYRDIMYRVITKQPESRTDGSPRNPGDVLVLVALVALVALVVLRNPGTQRTIPAPVIVFEPTHPMYLSWSCSAVMTRIVANVPAGLLDRAASVYLHLHLDAGETYEWSTPIGGEGSGSWTVRKVKDVWKSMYWDRKSASCFQFSPDVRVAGVGWYAVVRVRFRTTRGGAQVPECSKNDYPISVGSIMLALWRSGGRHFERTRRRYHSVSTGPGNRIRGRGETCGGVLLGPFPAPRNQTVYSVRPLGTTIDFAKRLSVIPILLGWSCPNSISNRLKRVRTCCIWFESLIIVSRHVRLNVALLM